MEGIDGGRPGLDEVKERAGVIGVVLCGGASRRMGTDKGSIRLGDGELVDLAIDALDEVCDEVVLACGTKERYADRGLRLVMDEVGDRGPLEGIVACLDSTQAEWAVVLACDLPRVVSAVPSALLACARSGELDVCLFESRRGKEPLVAVYRHTALAPMKSALAEGMRRVDSFHGYPRGDGTSLEVGGLHESELPEGVREVDVAHNLNTPLELASERARRSEVVR